MLHKHRAKAPSQLSSMWMTTSSQAKLCTFSSSCVLLQDPVDGSLAVLVKKWDITSEKQIELQLEASQEALQR